MSNELIRCKYCDAMLNPNNVARHELKVHRDSKSSPTTLRQSSNGIVKSIPADVMQSILDGSFYSKPEAKKSLVESDIRVPSSKSSPSKDKKRGRRRVIPSSSEPDKGRNGKAENRVHGYSSHSVMPQQPKEEICPVCGGDGGARGGCYKCDGSGWVASTVKISHIGPIHLYGKRDLRKVTNANYVGTNKGAVFRDGDGRIGSIPSHDDHSDESGA